MPLEVWNPRWSRSLQRLFNSKSSAGPLSVLDDVMPVVQIADPTANENHYQRAEVPFAISGSCAAAAGTYGKVVVDTRPGYLTVLETIHIGGNAAAMSILAYIGTLSGAACTLQPVSLDLRTPNVPGLQFSVTDNATAPAGNEVGRWYFPILAESNLLFGAEAAAVLYNDTTTSSVPAKGAFALVCGSLNVGFNFWITGYTRPLDAGEVQL